MTRSLEIVAHPFIRRRRPEPSGHCRITGIKARIETGMIVAPTRIGDFGRRFGARGNSERGQDRRYLACTYPLPMKIPLPTLIHALQSRGGRGLSAALVLEHRSRAKGFRRSTRAWA